jgi:hypothetical protein
MSQEPVEFPPRRLMLAAGEVLQEQQFRPLNLAVSERPLGQFQTHGLGRRTVGITDEPTDERGGRFRPQGVGRGGHRT